MSKQISEPFQNFVAASMSGTNTIYSTISNIIKRDTVNIQLQWTGSPVGTFKIQGCNDYKPQLTQAEGYGAPNSGTWTTLPVLDPVGGTTYTTIPTSVGTPISVNLTQLGCAWIQVVYANTSGTGTLTGIITAKSLG